jgi:biofilm PGA synthesis N-glycosyltransferase PgaC
MMLKFSMIIPAYREEGLNKLLKILLNQNLSKCELERIIVIAGGYKKYHFLKNKNLVIIKEKGRRGKASAINSALKKTTSNVIVLMSADILPKKNTIKNLLNPFSNNDVGMTTGRPVSLDNPKKFVGFINNLVWNLHHHISRERAKAGEILAFKKLIERIPRKLAADESYLESVISKNGYKIVYVPNAIIFNEGPKTISHFLKQRKRIFIGHLHVRKKYRYSVSTMNIKDIFKAVIEYFETRPFRNYKEMIWFIFAVLLEIYVRISAIIHFYLFKEVPYKWELI